LVLFPAKNQNFFPDTDEGFGAKALYPCSSRLRCSDLVPNIYWKYNRTGHPSLLDLAARV